LTFNWRPLNELIIIIIAKSNAYKLVKSAVPDQENMAMRNFNLYLNL